MSTRESEAALVARARAGEAEAFKALVETHGRSLYGLAYRLTSSPADADDIVQDSFFKAWRKLHRFDDRASFRTWMHKIVTNTALDLIRKRGRRPETPEEEVAPTALPGSAEPDPERRVAGRELGQRVHEALGDLSARERAAFVLRHFEERTTREIGEALGVTPNASKQLVFRAVRKMRASLEAAMAPGGAGGGR